MNKQELTVVVILFLLLIGWMGLQSKLAPPPEPVPDPVEADAGIEPGGTNSVSTNEVVVPPAIVPTNEAPAVVQKPEPAVIAEPTAASGRELQPEQVAVLSNDFVQVTVSSRGGAIQKVVFSEYPETQDEGSDPVILDFSSHPALALSGIPALGTASDYDMVVDASGRSLVMTETTKDGLVLERALSLGDGYSIKLTDTFRNRGDAAIVVPDSSVGLGPMKSMLTPGKKKNRYSTTVGLNTFSSVGGMGVVHWEKKGPEGDKANLAARFVPGGPKKGFGCGGPKLTAVMPARTNVVKKVATEWISAKNRFFIQILAAEEAGTGYTLWVERNVPDEENPDDPSSWARVATLDRAWAELQQDEKTLQPGTELVRRADYFVGPQKFSLLAELGREQDKVMFRAWKNWGWFRSICTGMLRALNWIYGIIPNYGVAIILLTIAVRILFWPFTHKSTKSMEKMREIQPEVARLKEKYEKDPQRLQRETMLLYREHGVNPMASCLPMVFQMPVFIGLFIVLRSAVELRFEGFLWIRDLSEPEGLLQGLPVIGELNILPVLMTATMILQQKLTPQTGDAQQQKMMMFFMPLFLLYIMYSMPSALTLYWTVSQVLAVSQLLIQRRNKAKATPAPA